MNSATFFRSARTCRLAILFSLLLGTMLSNLALAASEPPRTLAELFAARARAPSQQARFIEHRTLGELDLPLESRGELQFEPPATLRKKTLEPLEETLELTGDSLSVTINGTRRSLPLDAVPAAASLAIALRGLVAGKLDEVQQHFEMSFTPAQAAQGNRWTLTMMPSNATVAAVLKMITASGSGERIEQIDIQQSNGDQSLMRILPAS